MSDWLNLTIGIVGVLIVVGRPVVHFILGHYTEKWHLQSLKDREHAIQDFYVTQIESFPGIEQGSDPPRLIVVEVIVAMEFWRSVWANLVNYVGGGNIRFRNLMIRAHREALLQLQEQARAKGFNALCHVQIASSDLTCAYYEFLNNRVALTACAMAYHAAR